MRIGGALHLLALVGGACAFHQPTAFSSSSSSRRPASSLLMGKAGDNSLMDLEGSSGDEGPRKYGKNGTFLGIRRESGYLRRSMEQGSSVAPLMPDGGLSPCVIKVLGVGGGGSNAVSCLSVEICPGGLFVAHLVPYSLNWTHLKVPPAFIYCHFFIS